MDVCFFCPLSEFSLKKDVSTGQWRKWLNHEQSAEYSGKCCRYCANNHVGKADMIIGTTLSGLWHVTARTLLHRWIIGLN